MHTCTAAYAIDLGVTLLFRWSFDATLQRTVLLLDLVEGKFSAVFSSSKLSFAEDGDVKMLL